MGDGRWAMMMVMGWDGMDTCFGTSELTYLREDRRWEIHESGAKAREERRGVGLLV